MPLDEHLVKRAQELLNRARVLPEASAGQVQLGHRQPGSRAPHSPGISTLEQILGRLRHVRTDEELQELIEFAEQEIRAITHTASSGPETREQFRYRVCTEYKGKPAMSPPTANACPTS